MADTVNYEVDPNDERLTNITAEGETILDDSNAAYDSAIASNNKTLTELQGKIDANTADLQKAQQATSDLAIQGIEQNKADAKKDYLKEQSGAYVDWQKQSNQYGANAEMRAANGMTNTGYTESSQVAMYNQYQNRIATARESYTRAVTAYNQSIAEAKAANSVALAEIASNALAQSLEIAMQFAMQNNTLLTQKAQAAATIRQQNFQNYMSVYNSIVAENTLAEEVRQYNETHDLQERQFAWQKEQAAGGSGGSGGGSSAPKGGGASISKFKSKGSSRKVTGQAKINENATKSTQTTEESSEPTVDMNSVLALGYGPISEEYLNNLVKSGKVIEYVEDGQIKFKKVFNY